MQLYVIDWLFQNAEDQLFAIKEFCEYFKKENFNESVNGIELKFIAHTLKMDLALSFVWLRMHINIQTSSKCGEKITIYPSISSLLYRIKT